MEGKIVTDICVLVFFILLIAFRRYLFTKRFLKILKENWFWFSIPVGFIAFLDMSFGLLDTPHAEFIAVICMFFVGYFFIYGYFSVNVDSLRNRKSLRKKWQIAVLPFISILTFDQACDYFTTEPYHSLDIIIFVFFLGTVVYVSHFLLKETFFSKGGMNNNKPKL